ncbi:hypothetical protein Tco_1363247 [Tanacetum coccineum]
MAALQYKDDHNRIAYLGRERGSEDFTDILSYLDHSPLRYALTHDPPVVFDSLVKQFWATATVRPNAAGSHDLVATIDGREVVVTESLIRAQLQLDDANGIFDMQIDDIFAGMGAIGYPPGRTLTFLKHHFSPQWRFLVHTILHCLSPKAGSWNQFPSSIATALICLSTGRVYNFSRFILEGMIANVKSNKHKFLMYPRFLQMLVAIETADRTPRPTSGFTRKLFSNMKLKWEGEEIPLTPPMLAIAAAGNDAADDDDAANEDNAAADEAAGSAAEAHPVPHSPLVSPVRELTPERQSASERPPSLSPTPPAQTSRLAEPLVFGPAPRPAGYVDPDVLEPIIFGPQPRPYDFVDPALEEPVIFGPPPRPDNYIEPEDIDNLVSMEDDTILGGFHEESPAGPNDAPTPTADAAGRAEDPTLLTSLSATLDRCMGRIDSLETELGTSKKIMGGAILTLVSRVKKLERTVKQLRTARLVGDAPATEGDVDIQDDVDLEGLSRMASEALGHDQATVPSEDMEEREEEEVIHVLAVRGQFIDSQTRISSESLFLAEDTQPGTPSKNEQQRKSREALKQSEVTQMMRNLVKNQWCAAHNGTITMKAVKAMSKQQLIEEYENICRCLEKDRLLSAQYNLFRPKPAITEPPSKRQRVERASSQPSTVPAATTQPADDHDSAGGSSFHPAGSAPHLSWLCCSRHLWWCIGVSLTSTISIYAQWILLVHNHVSGSPSSTLKAVGDVAFFFLYGGNVIQTVQAGLRESYECLASAPLCLYNNFGVSACTAPTIVFSSPWLNSQERAGSTIANGFDAIIMHPSKVKAITKWPRPTYGDEKMSVRQSFEELNRDDSLHSDIDSSTDPSMIKSVWKLNYMYARFNGLFVDRNVKSTVQPKMYRDLKNSTFGGTARSQDVARRFRWRIPMWNGDDISHGSFRTEIQSLRPHFEEKDTRKLGVLVLSSLQAFILKPQFAIQKELNVFGTKGKAHSLDSVVPDEILERIGEVRYRLALPPQIIARIHYVFSCISFDGDTIINPLPMRILSI